MANKQTDPIQALANDIVNTIDSIATRRSDKASFDKSFYATILGVNRKFTDDITVEEQAELIQKFSIPESVADNEPSYYTIKINGAYYCKAQNGDFKLYEKVMAYIPNGEWSKMYIDRVGSGGGGDSGGGSSIDIPNIIKAVDAPGGEEPLSGDLWFYTTSESITEFTSITEDTLNDLYEYATDEDTQITQWTKAEYVIAPEAAQVPIVDHDGVFWIRTAEDSENFERIYVSKVSGSVTKWKQVYPDSETGYTPNIIVSSKKPMLIGDIWLQIDDEESENLTAVYQYEINPETNKTEWMLLCYANVPQVFTKSYDPSTEYTVKNGDYWIEIDNETDQNIVALHKYQLDEDTQTMQLVTLYNAAVPSVYIQVNDPVNTYTVKNGAYWIEIDNDTDKNMKYLKKRIEDNWVIQCAAISGTDVTINISHAILVDKGQIVN